MHLLDWINGKTKKLDYRMNKKKQEKSKKETLRRKKL